MQRFNYSNTSIFQGHRLIGILIMASGIFGLLSPQFFTLAVSETRVLLAGGGACFFGLMILSAYEGTIIELSQKKVKYFTSFMGFKFGRWEALPAISSIKVVSNTSRIINEANGVSPTMSGDVTDHTVFAYALDAGIPYFSFSFSKEQEATDAANQLAKAFGVELE